MKKIFLILFGILFALLIIEISLQIAGLTVKKISAYKHNHQINTDYDESIKNKKTITVMCIGESTTDGQYPLFLEEYLSKYIPDKKFNVIDSGYICINLDDLYYNVKTNIVKYKPDIIVGMIGINDTTEYVFKIISQKLKIMKLLNLISYSYKKQTIDQLIEYKSEDKLIEYKSETTNLSKKKADSIKNKLADSIFGGNKEDKSSLLFLLSQTTKTEALNIYGMQNEFFRLFLSEYYDNYSSANITFDELIEVILKENNINKEFRYGLKGILDIIGGNYPEGIYNLNKADAIRRAYDYSDISKKYKKILDLIIPNKIKFIAMQYPVRDIESLKKIIEYTGYSNDVIFVSNKDTFRQALMAKNRQKIFEDLFAWDFGHCTELGNRLIADNLAKEISKIFN